VTTATKNRIQDIQLELMRLGSFNDFDGERVAKSLEKHRDLWSACVMDRLNSLIKLRDLSAQCWNVDTLFITPQPGREAELLALAKRWNADEVDWLPAREACDLLGSWSPSTRNNDQQVLRVWWD
jgi:hypothetical protein